MQRSATLPAPAESPPPVQIGRLPWAVFGYAFVAAMASFVYGFNAGIIAPAIIFIRKSVTPEPTVGETSAIVSSILLAAIVGSLLAGPLADRYGRVRTIVWNSVLMLVAALCAALAGSPGMILLSRALLGVGVGIASIVPSLYIAEIAPAAVRGGLGALNQLLGWSGVVAAYFVGYFTVTCAVGDGLCWRYMFAFGGVFCIFQLILTQAVLPETPRWLMTQGQSRAAMRVLLAIYGRANKAAILQQFQAASERVGWREPALLRIKDWKAKRWGRPLWRALGLQLVQQASCNAAVLYYSTMVIHAMGVEPRDALFYNAVASLPQLIVLGVLLALVDRRGRRPALLFSQVGVILALGLLGTAAAVSDPTVRFWLLLAGVTGHRAAFAAGLGPLPGVLTPELLPLPVRSRGLGMSGASNWLANFIVCASFPVLLQYVPAHTVYWTFGVLSAIGFFFVLYCIPETSGSELDAAGPCDGGFGAGAGMDVESGRLGPNHAEPGRTGKAETERRASEERQATLAAMHLIASEQIGSPILPDDDGSASLVPKGVQTPAEPAFPAGEELWRVTAIEDGLDLT